MCRSHGAKTPGLLKDLAQRPARRGRPALTVRRKRCPASTLATSLRHDHSRWSNTRASAAWASAARRDRGCAHVVRFIGHTSLRLQVSRDLPFVGEPGAAWCGHMSFRGGLVQTGDNNSQPHEARFHVVSGGFSNLQIHAESNVFGFPAGSARVGDIPVETS